MIFNTLNINPDNLFKKKITKKIKFNYTRYYASSLKVKNNNDKKILMTYRLNYKSLYPIFPRLIEEEETKDKTKFKKKIYSKEILLFSLLYDVVYLCQSKKLKKIFPNNTIDFNINIKQGRYKKKKINKISFIRAPYKNKSAQVQITKKYYKFTFLISFYLNGINLEEQKHDCWLENFNTFFFFNQTFKFFSSNHIVLWSKEFTYNINRYSFKKKLLE